MGPAAENSGLAHGQAIPALAPTAGVCPACGGTEVQSLFSADDRLYRAIAGVFEIVECRACRLVRMWPQPSPAILGQCYPDNYWLEPDNPQSRPIEQAVRRFLLRGHVRFVERALRECEEPGSVVDVGCGGGLFLQSLAERRENVVGLEFAVDSAEMVWRNRGVPVACGTLSRPPFAPGSCAAVTLFHVLEHLYNPASYLEAAHQMLGPDGRLILQIRNASSWQFLLFGEHWSGLNVPRHLIQFRRRDAEALLNDCGFEILREKHFNWRDSAAGCATTLAPSLDPSVRRLRRTSETPGGRFWKDAGFFALSLAFLPLAFLEACCRAGSYIIFEARKK